MKLPLTGILSEAPRAAAKFASEIDKALSIIAEAPDSWPLYIHGTRKFLLWRFRS